MSYFSFFFDIKSPEPSVYFTMERLASDQPHFTHARATLGQWPPYGMVQVYGAVTKPKELKPESKTRM